MTEPVETSQFILTTHQRFITTGKEYLLNSHILLKYFELVFLQLHLLKISCKLIAIQLSYKRYKKGAFYEFSPFMMSNDRIVIPT